MRSMIQTGSHRTPTDTGRVAHHVKERISHAHTGHGDANHVQSDSQCASRSSPSGLDQGIGTQDVLEPTAHGLTHATRDQRVQGNTMSTARLTIRSRRTGPNTLESR